MICIGVGGSNMIGVSPAYIQVCASKSVVSASFILILKTVSFVTGKSVKYKLNESVSEFVKVSVHTTPFGPQSSSAVENTISVELLPVSESSKLIFSKLSNVLPLTSSSIEAVAVPT
jgi:hypothetical protein